MKLKTKIIPDFSFETNIWQQGQKLVVGVDEVGRGPLAGPVVAAAVIFSPETEMIKGVNDSKKVTARNRLILSELIKQQALSWAIGSASVEVINQLGIVSAITQAMANAIEQLPRYDHVLIDGRPFKNFPKLFSQHITYIVKGDQKSYSIASASIIAKVYRDELMGKLSLDFPNYGWEKNMGYGTKEHIQAIRQYGPTVYHRRQFIQKIISSDII